jgi:hypothetical protein
MINLSISSLAEDNWWWRPDFLTFLQGLMKTVDEDLPLAERTSLLRIPLTEEMGKRDLELSQQRSPGAIIQFQQLFRIGLP